MLGWACSWDGRINKYVWMIKEKSKSVQCITNRRLLNINLYEANNCTLSFAFQVVKPRELSGKCQRF